MLFAEIVQPRMQEIVKRDDTEQPLQIIAIHDRRRPGIAQNPGNTSGSRWPSNAPRAPPIMKIGASTPPEVPDSRDNAQMSVFTIRMPRAPFE